MKLTITERAILANQNRILAFLDENNSDNYNLKAEILEEGYEGSFDKCFDEISEGVSKEICEETHEILTMFRVINNLSSTLSNEEKESINLDKIKFEGFDANYDKHYGYMTFLVDKADLYKELKGKHLNSHDRLSLGKYQLMLPVYHSALKANNHHLDLIGLQRIISSI
jgi:uncharacterized protein YfbU (UPF0304 family)